MKLNSKMFSLSLVGLLASGCAHSLMRGSVAMKISDNEAHECLGNNEVKVGDRVTAFNNVCTAGSGKDGNRTCDKVKVGSGKVTRLLNEHYSVVSFDDSVKFQEGTVVEKN